MMAMIICHGYFGGVKVNFYMCLAEMAVRPMRLRDGRQMPVGESSRRSLAKTPAKKSAKAPKKAGKGSKKRKRRRKETFSTYIYKVKYFFSRYFFSRSKQGIIVLKLFKILSTSARIMYFILSWLSLHLLQLGLMVRNNVNEYESH